MADDQVPQLTGPHGQNRAREILDGMSDRRIDPKRIKTTVTGPCARGGQGTVTLGTMILPEETAGWVPEQLLKTFLEKKFAIKKLEWNRQDAEASAKFFKSFVNEISIMASVSHPNIVKFVGFVEDVPKGDAWIISPWEANGNLREFLQSGKWEIPERVSLVQDIADGAEYLHTRQPPICHGDLKSLNILVNSSYHAVITDFGSARTKQNVGATTRGTGSAPLHQAVNDDVTRESTSPKIKLNPSTLELTLTGPGFSLRWTAPEVLNNGEQDLPSDLWAIGWICWEIFTGRIPFEGLNFQGAIISHVIKGKLPAIREEAELSHILKLCSLMSDCWISNPVERIDASTFRRKVRFTPSTTPSGHTSRGAKLRSAALSQELGTMYRLQNDVVMAEVHYQSARDIATRTKDDRAKAIALDGLGSIYRTQSRHEEAEKALREAYEINSRVGSDLGAANVLDGLGENYRAQARYQEAERAFKEAHEIHSRIDSDLGAANALNGLGSVYRAQSRNYEAEKVLMEAYRIHSRIGNDLGTANTLDGLGEIYRVESRNTEAEEVLMEAHHIHSRIGDDRGAANALVGLGNTYRALSRNQEAEKAFNDAYNIFSRIGDGLGTGNALRSLAMLYSDQGRYNDAEASYHQAVAVYERADSGNSKARALLALGKDHHAQRRYAEAEEAVTEALAIWISIGDEQGQAGALLLLSEIFRSQSRLNEETEALTQAEVALARVGDGSARAESLDRLGDIHLGQGIFDEAEECYRLAQAIFLSTENVRGEATELLSLGVLYVRQDRYGEAVECFADGRIAYARMVDEYGEAKALDGLAGAYVLQRQFVDAKAACVEAREMYAQMGRPASAICAETWKLLQHLENPLGSLLGSPFLS